MASWKIWTGLWTGLFFRGGNFCFVLGGGVVLFFLVCKKKSCFKPFPYRDIFSLGVEGGGGGKEGAVTSAKNYKSKQLIDYFFKKTSLSHTYTAHRQNSHPV